MRGTLLSSTAVRTISIVVEISQKGNIRATWISLGVEYENAHLKELELKA